VNLLLDTCAIIFIARSPTRLSAEARRAVTDAGNTVFVSVVSVGELACLSDRKRIILPGHWKTWFRGCADAQGWNVVPLSVEVMEEAYSLPDPIHRDPVDRVLIATARLEGMTVVTTDRLILDYPHAKAMA
jgi:PIN domain nuclease of toxin-antitoxin system